MARGLSIALHSVGVVLLISGAVVLVRRGDVVLALIPIGSALGLVGSLVFDVFGT